MPITGGEGVALVVAAVGASVVTLLVLKQVAPTIFTTVVQAVPVRPVAMPPANAFVDAPYRGSEPMII